MTGEGITSARDPAPEESPRTETASMTSAQDGYDAQQILALARHPPPGASVYSPTAVASAALNPRSCVTCRRRKVRCDKHMPCSNCRRAQIPCIFPAPGRAPRRPRPKDPNAPAKQPSSERELELMKRLRKLEGIVEELSGQIEVETVRQPYSTATSPEAGRDDHTIGGRLGSAFYAASPASGGGHSHDSPTSGPGAGGPRLSGRPGSGTLSEPDSLRKASPDVHKQFGRLVLGEKGVTRYVSSGLWSSINDELDELRKESQHLTDEESEESDLEATPESTENDKNLIDHQSFILGYRSADVDLKSLHPLPSQIPFIWQVYQENVDPILKVIHVPSMSKVIKDLRHNMDNLTPPMEALMFSIYYASITSLEEDEVKLNFNAEKSVLIQQYRFALEQALAKAEFLTKPDITVVQAFLLFLVLVRRHDDTRFVWSLTALVIRMSQALGLHRDGTHFPNLTPFEIEMRRRVFWAVCVLDLRSAEDQGTDFMIVDGTFDTQLPLNINDNDISEETQDLPEPREGTTDMAFSLIRYEICALSRRLHTASSDMTLSCPRDAGKSLEEREALLTDLHRRVKDRLLKDNSNPMFWVASNLTRVIVAKMTLVIYQPVLFPGPGNEYLSEEVRARLFNSALEVFEYTHILNTDSRCRHWRWLFQTWSHWHALAYTLIEASHRPWGPKSERAWAALNLTFSDPKPADLEKLASHHAVWVPLRKLYLKVKKHREAEIARLRADPQAARELDTQDRAAGSPTSFAAIPNALIVLERWRKLVNAPAPTPDSAEKPQQEQQQQQQQHPPPLQVQGSHGTHQGMAVDGLHAGSNVDFVKPELMEYLDAAMTSPTFVSTDFAALFPADGPEMARASLFGYPVGDVSRVDSSLGFNPSTPLTAHAGLHMGGTPAGMGTAAHMQQQTPQHTMVQTPQNDDNLPSWLWPASGSPDFLRMPNMTTDDMDMNVDEGFDWQTWQESLGRYEMEANGGRVGSTWGPGL
ncbi:All development altered-3 [Madurella fahalii]|uniref:All development altered-3 n=1 Tax=Madurella fahalii TaxID=1157608 RepID=A0ABQ0FWM5_9PEZI